MSFILRFFILKGSLSKSNTVSRSVRQLQSPALWSGPSILSPTSWLFKRAKAQQCSFLNTQIHPSTNRGTAVWQKSLSFSFTLSHSPALPLSHLGLWHPLLSLPTLLHRPHYTRILLSLSLHPSVSHLTGQLPHFTIHLPLLLLCSLYLSVIVLSIPLPSFTFFFSIPSYFSCPHSLPGTLFWCPASSLFLQQLNLYRRLWLTLRSRCCHSSYHTRNGITLSPDGMPLPWKGSWSERWLLKVWWTSHAHPCLNEGWLLGPLGGEHELVHWSAHYSSVGTVLQGIYCVALELITPGSYGAQGTQKQQGLLQR